MEILLQGDGRQVAPHGSSAPDEAVAHENKYPHSTTIGKAGTRLLRDSNPPPSGPQNDVPLPTWMVQAFSNLDDDNPLKTKPPTQTSEPDVFAFHPPSPSRSAAPILNATAYQTPRRSTDSTGPRSPLYEQSKDIDPPIAPLTDYRLPYFSASPTISDHQSVDSILHDGSSLQISHETANIYTSSGNKPPVPFSAPGPFCRLTKAEDNEAPISDVVIGHLPFSIPGPNTTAFKASFRTYDTINVQDPAINEPSILLSSPSPHPHATPLFSSDHIGILANRSQQLLSAADNNDASGYSAYDTLLNSDLPLPSLDHSMPMRFANVENVVVHVTDNPRPDSVLSVTPEIKSLLDSHDNFEGDRRPSSTVCGTPAAFCSLEASLDRLTQYGSNYHRRSPSDDVKESPNIFAPQPLRWKEAQNIVPDLAFTLKDAQSNGSDLEDPSVPTDFKGDYLKEWPSDDHDSIQSWTDYC
ncbi:hypothetical protein SISNIDRAFT_140921 [Sistotremastrum niveocremeum HHB9708]|uniref:Uncharacterized protein n=1 Tax=Sistotremastrum niveocremeum HHB9708 TaxID=1314777 RepID=A0A165A1B8_9AGAM|nr:hypothetical protein SISNIDRAFT_140921 [Sistotremastrum niveocremeum HHB9708]